jgi:hypothetical protein
MSHEGAVRIPLTQPSISAGEEKLAAAAIVGADEPLSEHQEAALGFTEFLAEQEMDAPVRELVKANVAALPSHAHRARHRVEAFLEQQKAKARSL